MEHEKILTADWDDMVFEGRNKEYGAYDLRKRYSKHVNTALAVTVAGVLLAFSIPYIKALFDKAEAKKPIAVVDVTKLAAPPPLDKTLPPPPPPDLPPPPPKTIKFTPPVVKPDEEVPPEQEPPKVEEMKEAEPATETNIDPNANVDFSNVPVTVDEPAPTKPVMFVEKMPAFPGGEDALRTYLGKSIKYPPAARENGIEGTVVLQFVVNTDGSISDIKVLRDIGGGCADEAIRVVKNMPKWSPGNNNGVAVPVYFNLPVTFQLSSQ